MSESERPPIRMLRDMVLVRRLESTDYHRAQDGTMRTAGGLVVPEAAIRKAWRGQVVSVGPGAWCRFCDGDPTSRAIDGVCESCRPCLGEGRREMETSVGDVVVWNEYGGGEVTIAGERYVLLGEFEILGVEERVCSGRGRSPECTGLPVAPHECPFQSEINDDHELCDCCDACAGECADDI